jgi:glycosyltransferase involved in cell wall biosynthesis
MRFHVLGIPHTISNKDYLACAYTQKVVKFCKMMTQLGHHVFHYGHELSQTDATEQISVIDCELFDRVYDKSYKVSFPKYDLNDDVYQTFFKNTILEIQKRKEKNDFILPFWGLGGKPVCDAHPDLICVEPGIGYSDGHWARWKIFESYAIYHAYLTLSCVKTCQQDNYDVVIPNYFDKNDFDFVENKDEYFLFIGRVYEGKGVNIAIQVTERIGKRLIVAGQGSLRDMGYDSVPEHVTEFGYAGIEDRKKLMSLAKAVFVPSQYLEPFGGVQIESLLSGTPIITSDWGASTEVNLHGVTGYRCRTFDHYVWASQNVDKINPKNCRKWGENFCLEAVGKKYEEYFKMVLNTYENKGWYEIDYNRTNIDLMSTEYPSYPPLTVVNKKRIAIFSRKNWAFGRVYSNIIDHSSHLYNYEYINWANFEQSKDFFHNGWKNFDIILSNTAIFSKKTLLLYDMKSFPDEMINKTIITSHYPLLDQRYFEETLNYHYVQDIVRVTITGISKETCNNVREQYKLSIPFTPSGVNIKDFNYIRDIKQISIAGIVGDKDSFDNNIDYESNKRSKMFLEICQKSNLKNLYISGFPLSSCKEMYANVDIVICTSRFEGNPLGVFEAIACHIPVISTKVGNVVELQNIKTFETVEDAVDIIEKFNKNPESLSKYIKDLTEEVRTNWDWKTIFDKHWQPVFETKLKTQV